MPAPNAMPSPTLSIDAPKIISKVTPKPAPKAILSSFNDFLILFSFNCFQNFSKKYITVGVGLI